MRLDDGKLIYFGTNLKKNGVFMRKSHENRERRRGGRGKLEWNEGGDL